MSAQEQEYKDVSRRFFEEVWNEGKLAAIDELTDPGYILHDPLEPMAIQGPEGFKQYVARNRAAFPDVHFTIQDLIAEGDLVVVRWSAKGTFTGPLLGFRPTGKSGTVTGITITRIAGGKAVEAWVHKDDLGMLQQMGVVPELAAVPV